MAIRGMPEMWLIRQRLHSAPLANVEGAVHSEFSRLRLADRICPGAHVAITAGSRGISRVAEVIRALADAVREAGGRPFIVPSMGSHGGATAEGQQELLRTLGITEDSTRTPIRSTMDVEQLGATPEGIPVYMDRHAAAADGILVVNRVKQHTDFSGRLESGLLKMVAIGLGKRRQAEAVHIHGAEGLRALVAPVARVSLSQAPILAGFALLEDGYHCLARVVGVLPAEMEPVEAALLRWAKRLAPRIPFDDIDLLVVDQIGKNLSGTGMDTKVIGRVRIPHAREALRPRVRLLFARDLSPETGGNAIGIGLADVVTRRMVERIDWQATNANLWTSGFLERGKVGIVAADDSEALEAIRYLLRDRNPEALRVLRISDTRRLGEMQVSSALLPQARALDGVDVLSGGHSLPGAP